MIRWTEAEARPSRYASLLKCIFDLGQVHTTARFNWNSELGPDLSLNAFDAMGQRAISVVRCKMQLVAGQDARLALFA